MKTVAILILLAAGVAGCGTVDAIQIPDAGSGGTGGNAVDTGAGGAAGMTGAAGEIGRDAAGDASSDAGVDAYRDGAIDTPCVPRACIVCVNGVPTTPPGACM